MTIKNIKIGVIGLGYVGLPLAVEFAKKYPVYGFDINSKRIYDLNNNNDKTLEIKNETLEQLNVKNIEQLKSSSGLYCTNKINDLKKCNFYIITVPTPIDKFKNPKLDSLIKASKSVEILIKVIILFLKAPYISGATEFDCLPVIEDVSGFKLNEDFYIGYSPERINPGDKDHTISKIKNNFRFITKIFRDILIRFINQLSMKVLFSTQYKSCEVKVIENSQRDINITC